MVRKGWSVMELPSDGWVKVLVAALHRCSGLPQRWSEPFQWWWWAMEEETPVGVSNGHEQGAQFPSSSQSSWLGGASCSRGARGIVAACQSGGAEAQYTTTNFPDTDSVAVAREKVAKWEKVVEVLQGSAGAEVDAIRTALDRARVAAQEKLLTSRLRIASDSSNGPKNGWGRVGRNTCEASRSAGEETPIARGFRAQHSRRQGLWLKSRQ